MPGTRATPAYPAFPQTPVRMDDEKAIAPIKRFVAKTRRVKAGGAGSLDCRPRQLIFAYVRRGLSYSLALTQASTCVMTAWKAASSWLTFAAGDGSGRVLWA